MKILKQVFIKDLKPGDLVSLFRDVDSENSLPIDFGNHGSRRETVFRMIKRNRYKDIVFKGIENPDDNLIYLSTMKMFPGGNFIFKKVRL